ncbi:MAG: type II glyceraldehyde-3-phosphate dehydrogenase [Nitrosopumilus sp.]|uniref:Glyceraldehyde-3-phosphate dehydrogenase n=1 Tax=Nitrosopumilus zosterae TaxID=718286 RepID=A0A2S2KRU2_9ARCH|nr:MULTISPECIES: type II glyceraldehyde-3-phosphate dehydrogenase [Nitrosopumilus]MCV0367051.1 type II glyceraldehyde-3-phosphate dehydrogenase [Nitrosopumilus sp.]BDQ30995.1 type II glyceraldehyde-3-phosphate dehydrogenase [Nitrosopumilus zosterae]GBH34392.1 glyceraldehyde-3-phosphate dehydrogenase [Nitrosopumilus zosterae]
MKKVFVNGYGSIGSRITSFLKDDPEIIVVGVGKYSPDEKVEDAISKGLDVYVPASKIPSFSNYKIAGSIESVLDSCDLVIDAAPGGSGYKNKINLYEPKNIPAIYQGGETVVGNEAVSDLLFNSRVNYDQALGKRHVMQGSCNVTGMGRILEPLRVKFGDRLIRFDVTLVRRWADIEQTEKKVVDTIEMSEKPHHGDDVKMYFGKEAPLYVRAIKVPTRQMHLHIMDIRFKDVAPKPSEIHELFTNEFGVATIWTAKGTKDIRDYAEKMGFNFTDTNMIHIHANMTTSIDDTVQMMYSDDQTGIVIPENHMLLQAMLFEKSYEDAFAHTESIFHMKEKKEKLQEYFAKK